MKCVLLVVWLIMPSAAGLAVKHDECGVAAGLEMCSFLRFGVSLYLGTCLMTLYYRLCFMRRCVREMWADLSRPRAEAVAREAVSSRRWWTVTDRSVDTRPMLYADAVIATRHVYKPRGHEPSLRFTPDCFKRNSPGFKGTVQTYLAKYFGARNAFGARNHVKNGFVGEKCYESVEYGICWGNIHNGILRIFFIFKPVPGNN